MEARLIERANMTSNNENLPTQAVAALERGSKIEAIKIVRETSGVGLKEAKEIVERFIDRTPSVKSRMDSANAAAGKSDFGWLLIVAALAAVVYYFYSG
jgi:ribosomal protein L7/L12